MDFFSIAITLFCITTMFNNYFTNKRFEDLNRQLKGMELDIDEMQENQKKMDEYIHNEINPALDL